MSRNPPTVGTRTARTRAELEDALRSARSGAASVVLVPTMGYLHPGHLSLLDRAATLGDTTVISIFVNPLQFGPGEDLDRYPRDAERDLALAGRHGVALAFVPDESVVYPDGPPGVRVSPGPMGDHLCGPFRPGHFEGVLTVVAKLFGLVRPDVAVFGRKDLQQAALIRRMVHDLELGVDIDIGPLVREEDGLAMSSRNVYLSAEEREDALGIYRGLAAADERFREGEREGDLLVARARDVAGRSSGLELEYVEIVDPDTLDPVREARAGTVVAAAGRCGRTRLIDNLVLGATRPDPRVSTGAEEGRG